MDLHAKVKVEVKTGYGVSGGPYADGRLRTRLVDTTVGRALFNLILPEELRFVNECLDRGGLKRLVARAYP